MIKFVCRSVSMFNTIIWIIYRLLSFLPIACLVLLYFFAATATFRLGHFPVPSMNDPKVVGYDPLYYGVAVSAIGSLWTVPLWVISLWWNVRQKRPVKREAYLYALGWSLMLVQLIFDPFKLIYWYMD